MIVGEILGNGIDDNGNALVDENLSHAPVGDQPEWVTQIVLITMAMVRPEVLWYPRI